MLKISFFQITNSHINFGDFKSNRIVFNRLQSNTVLIDDGHIVVVQVNNAIGIIDNRRGIRCNEIFALTNPNNQRTSFTGSNQLILFVSANHYNTISAHYFRKSKSDSNFGRNILRIPVKIFNEINQNFSIGVRLKSIFFFL